MEERLQDRMEAILNRRRHELALYIEKMKGLSPLEKLNSGFSYAEDEQGRNVRSVAQVVPGEQLTVRVKDGRILTRVTNTEYL